VTFTEAAIDGSQHIVGLATALLIPAQLG
jgi:hypothetical protein